MKIKKLGTKLFAFILAVSLVVGSALSSAAAEESVPGEQIVRTESPETGDTQEKDLSVSDPEENDTPDNGAGENDLLDDDPDENDSPDNDPKESDPAEKESSDPESEDNDPAQNTDESVLKDGDLISDPEETEEGSADKTLVGSEKVSGSFTDGTKTAYEITITDGALQSLESYKAEVKGPDGNLEKTITDFTTEDSSTFTAILTIADLGGPGKYGVSVYKEKESGSELLDVLEVNVPAASAGAVTVSSVNKTTGTAVITVNNVESESGITSVKAEVCSVSDKTASYDYEMTDSLSGTWTATMSIENHKKIVGEYTIKVVLTDGNGFVSEAGTATVDFSGTTGTIGVAMSKSSGKYTVSVTGFTSSEKIQGMKACVWSVENGKDDLSWHDMTLSGTTYSFSSYIKDFKNFGKIKAQVYMVKKDGKQVLFGSKTFVVRAPSSDGLTVTASKAQGKFSLRVKNVTNTFKLTAVRAVVWRKADKSDKKIYKLTKSGKDYVYNDIYTDEFGGFSGEYKIRILAYTKNGPLTTLDYQQHTVAAYGGKLTFADKYAGKAGKMQTAYKLKLRGITAASGIEAVQFKVWSESDPSKVKWYTAASNGKGTYTATVKITSFKTDGQYKAAIYTKDAKGNLKLAKTTKIMKVNGVVGGTVVKVSQSKSGGKFTIALKNSTSPSGLKAVKFAVWTKADMSDKYTYTATANSDGSYSATIRIKNHQYNVGSFNISTLGVMGNGISKYKKIVKVSYTTKKDYTFLYKPETGKRIVGINNPSSGNIRFAVWGEKGGQEELQWYTASKSGKHWSSEIDLSAFTQPGLFHVHVYSGDTFIRELTFTATKSEVGKSGWYYESSIKGNSQMNLKFYYKNGKKLTDVTDYVNGPFQIYVNRYCNTITVYAPDGNNGYIIPVIAFACSTGLPGMETPAGTYYTYAKNRWEELMGPSWGQYSARVVDGIYIHSVPSNIPNSHYGIPWSEYNKLGSPASHGCIRVNVAAAKWIYDHCGVGTEVTIFDSSYPGPLGKPTTPQLYPGQDWDPTDPEI